MRLDLDIDPASLPTAQQKGVTRDGRVYTKAKVLRAKRRLVEALVFSAAQARDAIEAVYGTRAVRRIWEARDSGAPWSVAIEYVYCLNSTPRRKWGAAKAKDLPPRDRFRRLAALFRSIAKDGAQALLDGDTYTYVYGRDERGQLTVAVEVCRD